MATKKNPYALSLRKPRTGASEPALKKFERELGNKIPTEYRRFLACQNGGSPANRNVEFGKGPYQDSVVDSFFGLNELRINLERYSERVPTGYLPVADDVFDNLFVISQRRGSTNQILFWDHEKEMDESPLIFIAKNLKSFLTMLQPDKIVEYDIATITYRGGKTVRRVLPSRTFSLTRNAVVEIRDLRKGERIEEFGEKFTIAGIAFSREKGIG